MGGTFNAYFMHFALIFFTPSSGYLQQQIIPGGKKAPKRPVFRTRQIWVDFPRIIL
jgi:hypothetical protein